MKTITLNEAEKRRSSVVTLDDLVIWDNIIAALKSGDFETVSVWLKHLDDNGRL